MSEQRKCVGCGNAIPQRKRTDSIYCAKKCRAEQERKKFVARNGLRHKKLNSHTIGAVGELKVCADLLSMGYNVYRAVSPSSNADAVAVKDDKRLLVEITSGRRSDSGVLLYHDHKDKAGKFDLIAVVEANGFVTYIPDIV